MIEKKGRPQSAGSERDARVPVGDRLRRIASDLFYRQGIRAVGVDRIVNETGVTKPTFYRSFESKDQLISVCLQQQVDKKQAELDAIAARLPDDPLAQIRAIIRSFAEDVAAPDYRGCAVNNAAVEFPQPTHPVRSVVENSKAALRSRIAGLAARLPIDQPDLLADGLILLIEGASASRHTSGSQGPSSALVAATNALMAAFLGDRTSGSPGRTNEAGLLDGDKV